MDHKGNHYREFLTDWGLVERWCQRIAQLPDFLIDSAVNRIPADVDLPSAVERNKLREFLVKRKGYLFEHIVRWQGRFAGLPPRKG